MNCPHCGHAYPSPRNYCGACGGRLALYCRLCGFRNEAADRYCGGCGAGLAEGEVHAGAPGQAHPEVGAPPKSESAPVAKAEGSAMDELLQVAREAEEAPEEEAEVRVSQNDIDALFGG